MARHLAFQPILVWSAILLGLLGGFGLGAHMVFVLAFGYTPGPAFSGMVQVHGHLQLLGWTGLFIIGISTYKLPRLMSTAPLNRWISNGICAAVVGGLLLKSVSQLLLFYSSHEVILRFGVFIGSLLESFGILLYFFCLIRSALDFSPKQGSVSAAAIQPFLLVGLFGWAVYAAVNASLGWLFLSGKDFLLDPHWSTLSINVYIRFVLLPFCFAFSLSTLPIFLRLRTADWPVKYAAVLYGLGVLLNLAADGTSVPWLNALGVCVRVVAILWTVLEIDLLRLREPWFKKFRNTQDRKNRPPRRYAGDYGQFGNFEWLIYAAYGWLVVASLSEISNLWFGAPALTIVRHFYLLGFVTHLILGMAVRIVPGFLGRNSIASPMLVRLSFLLITVSILGRTMPLAFSALELTGFLAAYGYSGIFGMLALLCLGSNLFITLAQEKTAQKVGV